MPEQIRIRKHGTTYTVTAVFGLCNTSTWCAADWKNFIHRRGWDRVPRVWDIAQ